MEDIEKASKEHEQQFGFNSEGERNSSPAESFKAGVEFAQDWISVKITPEWYTGCRLDILVKNETFKYPASVKIHTIYSDKDIQELKVMFTHWRYLELK